MYWHYICSAQVYFQGSLLHFVDSATHLGHLFQYDLGDNGDIAVKSRNMVRMANCILSTFSGCDPRTLSKLFQSHCLSLYGAALWSLSSSALLSLEVSFNNILRKIWKLPRSSHTGIVHQTAKLQSLFNVIHDRSRTLLNSAVHDCAILSYSFVGYNSLHGQHHCKKYYREYGVCADFIRSFQLAGMFDLNTEYIISTISCN